MTRIQYLDCHALEVGFLGRLGVVVTGNGLSLEFDEVVGPVLRRGRRHC